METNKCQHSKHEWSGRVLDPKSCPNCKRYDWKETKENKGHKI